jgi:thiamine transport system permease protein
MFAGLDQLGELVKLSSANMNRFFRALDKISTSRRASKFVYGFSVVFFFALVLLPPIFGIVLKLDKVGEVFKDPVLLRRSESAISWSFILALTVAGLDILGGLPLAWLIVRRSPKWGNVVDTLADIPFIIPTVALGLSTLLFWGPQGPLGILLGQPPLSPGLILVVLLHFAFSLPVVVRVMVGELTGYRENFEIAAKTLGAEPFTAVRTVTLPILRPALVASFLLSFARSLSETGATIVVAGSFENGPTFIKIAKDTGLEGALSFASFVLIVGSITAFIIIKYLGLKLKLPVSRVWPVVERKLSEPKAALTRDLASLSILILLVITPSLFIALPSLQAIFDGTLSEALSGRGVWSTYWQSMILSYTIGTVVTGANMLVGMPMAVLIARRRLGKAGTSLMDTLVDIPIVVPSVALGVSLSFFWKTFGPLPELLILTMSHLAITYTYFVRAMSAAIESVPTYLEETARTLGARPLTVFRRIIFPLTKYSLFAGAILTFTRSVDETGASSAVTTQLKTVPVLLVDWIRGTQGVSASTQSLGVGLLVAVSFVSLFALRLAMKKRR